MTGARWEIRDGRSGVTLAELHGAHFNKRTAARIAEDIATVIGVSVTSPMLRTTPRPNPTLVVHGKAKAARWHVVTSPGEVAVADLYNVEPETAAKIAEDIATAIRLPVMLASNRGLPASWGDHPLVRSKGGHLTHGPRPNPKRGGRKKPWIVGGRTRYATREEAIAAANRIHQRTGVFAAVEYTGPGPMPNPRGGPRIVYNKLLGGWYVVTGPHQTPLNGRFNSKAEAQAWLEGGPARRNPSRSPGARAKRAARRRTRRSIGQGVGGRRVLRAMERDQMPRARYYAVRSKHRYTARHKANARGLNPRSRGEVDEAAARELELFIENDADLYRQQHIPILQNLWRKMLKGTYDHEKAVKLWGYLVENGAKKYNAEFGGGGSKWNEVFTVATRAVVARSLADTGRAALENREYSMTFQAEPVKFKDLSVGESFNFKRAPYGSMPGPWRKTSAKTYTPTRDASPLAGQQVKVSSSAVLVERVTTNPRRRTEGPRMPRRQRRAAASGRFAKARHHAAASVARGVRRLDLRRRLGFGVGREGVRHNPFTRQPATVARVADHYYELRSPGIETIGGQTKTQLMAWARSHGFAPTFVDERKRELRAQPFSNPKGRKLSADVSVGDVVSLNVGQYFGRYATVEKIGREWVTVRVHLTNRTLKVKPGMYHISNARAVRTLSVPEKHQLRIARDTLKLSDAGARIMGGPTKAEAREIIRRLTGREPIENRRKRHLSGRIVRTAGVRGRRVSNPRESEVAAARRTFRRLNEIEPGTVTRVRTTRGAPKVLAKLGEVVEIVYDSDKYAGSPHNPKGKVLRYSHRTKRPRPVLATDPSGREVHIVGGRMHPTPDGLVN